MKYKIGGFPAPRPRPRPRPRIRRAAPQYRCDGGGGNLLGFKVMRTSAFKARDSHNTGAAALLMRMQERQR